MLSVIGLVLTVLTIVLGVGQYREARRSRRLTEQTRTDVQSYPPSALVDNSQRITTNQLTGLQGPDLSQVWVYAPHPLETLPGPMHVALRSRVFGNLKAGIEYVYFVETPEGIERILTLLKRMNTEGGGSANTMEELKARTMVVVLSADDFLTHYTVHFKQNGEFRVFQSVVDPSRNDNMEALSSIAAEQFRRVMERKIEARKEEMVEGMRVRRVRRRSAAVSKKDING